MFERLKKLFTRRVKNPKTPQRGMITRTCKICGKTFTLPENVPAGGEHHQKVPEMREDLHFPVKRPSLAKILPGMP